MDQEKDTDGLPKDQIIKDSLDGKSHTSSHTHLSSRTHRSSQCQQSNATMVAAKAHAKAEAAKTRATLAERKWILKLRKLVWKQN